MKKLGLLFKIFTSLRKKYTFLYGKLLHFLSQYGKIRLIAVSLSQIKILFEKSIRYLKKATHLKSVAKMEKDENEKINIHFNFKSRCTGLCRNDAVRRYFHAAKRIRQVDTVAGKRDNAGKNGNYRSKPEAGRHKRI